MWGLFASAALGGPSERAAQLAEQSEDWPAMCSLGGGAPASHRAVHEAELDGTPGQEYVVTVDGGCVQSNDQQVFVVDGSKVARVEDPYGSRLTDETAFPRDVDGDGRDEIVSALRAQIWSLSAGQFLERTRPTSAGMGVVHGRDLLVVYRDRAERLVLDPASRLWRPGPILTDQELLEALAARIGGIWSDDRPDIDVLGSLALARKLSAVPTVLPTLPESRIAFSLSDDELLQNGELYDWLVPRLELAVWADPGRAEVWLAEIVETGDYEQRISAARKWLRLPAASRLAAWEQVLEKVGWSNLCVLADELQYEVDPAPIVSALLADPRGSPSLWPVCARSVPKVGPMLSATPEDPAVVSRAASYLAYGWEGEIPVDLVRAALAQSDEQARVHLYTALARPGVDDAPLALAMLMEAVVHETGRAKSSALRSLMDLRERGISGCSGDLLEQLDRAPPELRARHHARIAGCGRPREVAGGLERVQDRSELTPYTAVMPEPGSTDWAVALPALDRLARSTDTYARIDTARILGNLALLGSEDILVALLGDPWVERVAGRALGRLGSPRAKQLVAERVEGLLSARLGPQTLCDLVPQKVEDLAYEGIPPEVVVARASERCPHEEDEVRWRLLSTRPFDQPSLLPEAWIRAQLDHRALKVRRRAQELLRPEP